MMTRQQDSSTKTAIQAELENTSSAFHDLLGSVSDEEWCCRSGNAAWTIGTELWHIADSLRFIHGTIKRAQFDQGARYVCIRHACHRGAQMETNNRLDQAAGRTRKAHQGTGAEE